MPKPQLNPCFLAGHTAGFSFLPFTAQIALLIVLPAKRSFLVDTVGSETSHALRAHYRWDYIVKLKSDTAAK